MYETVAPRGSALTKTRALFAACFVGLSTLVGFQRNVDVVCSLTMQCILSAVNRGL